MKRQAQPKDDNSGKKGVHKKATYTLPPDALGAVDTHWRFHETLDARLADSKSEYIADLILRDALKKSTSPKKSSKQH